MAENVSVTDKQTCRIWVKKKIAETDGAARGLLSASACAFAASLDGFKNAGLILSYMPVRGECSPAALAEIARREGKRVAFPLCLPERRLALYVARSDADFEKGAYGIEEPSPQRCERVEPRDVDFAIIPGVAFDTDCNRVGHGAGYYDRLLCDISCVKVALAYDFQVFERVEAQPHDIKMDYIATNNGIIVNKSHLRL